MTKSTNSFRNVKCDSLTFVATKFATHMITQSTCWWESFRTLATLVRFFSSMHAVVGCQVSLLRKSFAAHNTRERLFAGVFKHDVPFYVLWIMTSVVAIRTRVGALSSTVRRWNSRSESIMRLGTWFQSRP